MKSLDMSFALYNSYRSRKWKTTTMIIVSVKTVSKIKLKQKYEINYTIYKIEYNTNYKKKWNILISIIEKLMIFLCVTNLQIYWLDALLKKRSDYFNTCI